MWASVIEGSTIEDEATVGPYSHLRPGSVVGRGAEVGNFAELKNTRLGAGSKQHHMSYLGDAQVGERVNVGAGAITANYDGTRKHPTTIGDGAFIGVDTMIVAPREIGAGARTGAGAVVTRDVPRASSPWASPRGSASPRVQTRRAGRCAIGVNGALIELGHHRRARPPQRGLLGDRDRPRHDPAEPASSSSSTRAIGAPAGSSG